MRFSGCIDSTWCTSFGQLSKPVLARERELRRGQARRWISGAQRVEMFLGLLAELLERRTVRQTPERWNGHNDLLSDIARVRSTG